MSIGAFALLASLLGALAMSSSAQAFTASPFWKCRASAVWASVAGNNRVEPIVANGNPSTANNTSPDRAQCATEEAGADNLATPLGIPQNVIAARSATAKTTITPETGRAIDQSIRSEARVEGLSVPLTTDTVVLGADVIRSQVTGSCVNNQIQLQGESEVLGLTLGGQKISLDQLAEGLEQALAPLAVVIDLKFNEQVREGRSLTVRGLHLKVFPQAGGAPLLELVVAETKGDADEFTCDPNRQIPGFEGQICPTGSMYDVLRGQCIIPASATNGLIIVGRPFQGPSGGTVVPLQTAIRLYGRTRCLTLRGGSWPAYAVVGTNKRDRITGTNRRDRILGRGGNDSLDGGRDRDCVDGGAGNDRVNGGVGSDILIGRNGGDTLTGNLDNDEIDAGAGNDHLNGGPGRDWLKAGAGNDTINAGYNADRVEAGSGNDAINIATQGPEARVNCGTGTDKVRLNRRERARTTGCEIRYIFRDR
ncbi:MAG TPA: calcium-binding protein [Baekduia sp.]|nr:calcium-binding protein [Baekduia sp.]